MGLEHSSKLNRKTPSQYLINYRKVAQIIADEQLKISRDVKRMWANMFTLWEKNHVFGVAGDWETWRRDNHSIDWDEVIELFVYEELRTKYNFCGYLPKFNRYYTDHIRPQLLSIC